MPSQPYEIRVHRLDADRCLVTFQMSALSRPLPVGHVRLLPTEERLACRAVVYLSGNEMRPSVRTVFRRFLAGVPHDPADLGEFETQATALMRAFLGS